MTFQKPRLQTLRFLRLTFAFITLAVSAVFAQNSSSAQSLEFTKTTYDSPAFSATYPVPDKDKPGVTYSSQSVTLKSGAKATMHTYALGIHNDADAFLVIYCDANLQGDTAGLDLMLDGAVATLENATPSPKTDATFSGFPARAVTANSTYTSGQTTYSRAMYERITVQGARVWQALVICNKSTNCTEADANKFFNSIKIR
jgi:hypothetical protein